MHFRKKTTIRWEHTKSRKFIAAEYIKKKKKGFSINEIRDSFLTTIFFRKQRSLSFSTNIQLTEKDEIIQDDDKAAETYNFSKTAISSLNINQKLFAMTKKQKHSGFYWKNYRKVSVLTQYLIIKNKTRNTNTFRFELVTLLDIPNEVKSLNSNEATTHNNIPLKILRQSIETTANTWQLRFNNVLSSCEFPENLILVDVRLVFKKKNTLEKFTYYHVSVLHPVLKIFERLNRNTEADLGLLQHPRRNSLW